jgi:hypothetical protein
MKEWLEFARKVGVLSGTDEDLKAFFDSSPTGELGHVFTAYYLALAVAGTKIEVEGNDGKLFPMFTDEELQNIKMIIKMKEIIKENKCKQQTKL